MKTPLCPCGSGKSFLACCEPYFSILGLRSPWLTPRTTLVDWYVTFSEPIAATFMNKAGTYVFRISSYLDAVVDQYLPLGFCETASSDERASETAFYLKNNILLSMLAAFSCLSQGFFVQSGTIIRSLFEDCLVLIDLFENEGQLQRFLQGKYSSNGLVSRVKESIPPEITGWYGYFSANFTHCGPLHPTPYLPRACYPDNYVIVCGLQDIVRAVATFHIILERLYFDQSARPLFWRHVMGATKLEFNEESPVFSWAEELGKDIKAQFPLDERKEGFDYDLRGYHTK